MVKEKKMLKKTIALSAMLCTSLFAQNIVKNGSFNVAEDLNKVPTNYQDKTKSWTVTDSDGFDDSYSVQLKSNNAVLRQGIVCKSNTEYSSNS